MGDQADQLRSIVKAVASAKQIPARQVPPVDFEPDRVQAWLARIPDPRAHRPLMTFCGWLWKTGTRDMDAVIAILEDRCKRNPDNPYSYYAPGGTARDCRAASSSARCIEDENEGHKRAEREWLAG